MLADHDDTLPPHALYEVVKAINEHPEADVIYSDEDKMDMDGGALFDPHFKPDFNIDLLRSVNYICHLFVVQRTIWQRRTGGFRQEYDGAQDYDFIFRCAESAETGLPHSQGACTTGAATRTLRPAIRKASSTPSRQVREPLWPTMTEMRNSRRSRVEKGVDYGIYHYEITGFRENRWSL